jgi:DNA polymerase
MAEKNSVRKLAAELKQFLSAQNEDDFIVAAAQQRAAVAISREENRVCPVQNETKAETPVSTAQDTLTVQFMRTMRPTQTIRTDAENEMNKTQKTQALQALAQTIHTCRRCPLGSTRLNAVPGEGNVNADVMFVGEGPGYDEDRQGRPFVGRAGQLLDKMILAMGLSREKVFIANIAKCHPMIDPAHPENRSNDRAPNSEEIACCRKYVEQQIALVCPKYVIALGGVAAKALISDAKSLGALRGQFYNLHLDSVTLPKPVQIIATYHPAALLRNPNWKKDAWADLQQVMDALGLKGARK